MHAYIQTAHNNRVSSAEVFSVIVSVFFSTVERFGVTVNFLKRIFIRKASTKRWAYLYTIFWSVRKKLNYLNMIGRVFRVFY